MDSTTQTAPKDSENINELLSRLTDGFDSPNSPRDYDIINETAFTGDAWIRQPKQALVTKISSTKLRPQVTLGFHSPTSS